MSVETNQNKPANQAETTAQKLAAALDQPVDLSAATKPAALASVAKTASPAAQTKVVKIAAKPKAKKAVAKKKPAAKKAVAKKPVAKVAAKPTWQAKKANNQAANNAVNATSKFNASEAAENLKSAFEKLGKQEIVKFSAEANEQIKQKVTDFAQKSYSQNTQLAKDLLAAKNVNQVFELQSKAAKQNLQQNLNQLLQIHQVCCESLSKAFGLLGKK